MENQQIAARIIEEGRAVMGMELGSTIIKTALTGPDNEVLATGSYKWENRKLDGIWTYSLDDVWAGIAGSFADLKNQITQQYGVALKKLAAMGVSGMMHGYLVFDRDGKLLVPFRTWRNNITGQAARELTEVLDYPIPQRWSVAHFHQALLNGEAHVQEAAFLTTVAGYVHWKLTGRKVLGIGDASGMFPVDTQTGSFDARRIERYNTHAASSGFSGDFGAMLPIVLPAGEAAGILTEEGALLIDPSGELAGGLAAGTLLCPPEGDAGTGMVATNSIRVRTGNVSAGTSVFAMLVLDREPRQVHPEIDLVTTPDGNLVGMAHSNNCTSDYDAWINLFGEAARALGVEVSTPKLYDTLLKKALEGSADCGGLLAYGYVSGEHLTGFSEGRPLFVRRPESALTLGNFMRAHLFTALCALRTGLDVLTGQEGVQVDEIRGHGGFFKTPEVGQRIMAAATGFPVSVLETAGHGGAWGMALLAAFMLRENPGVTLPEYLDEVFRDKTGRAVKPDKDDAAGFNEFFRRYHEGLAIEAAAVEHLP